MRESGNTNITYEYILDNVHERNLGSGPENSYAPVDQTVTYDEAYGELPTTITNQLITSTKTRPITEDTILTFRTGDWFVFLDDNNNIVSYGYVFIYFESKNRR